MPTNQFDAIVLGTGGVGSAALFELAKRGYSALGLDSHRSGHDRGSSHGETRVIRQAYFEHSDYVPLAIAACDLWNRLEERVGRRLFFKTGLLQAGPADGVVLSGVVKSAEDHGLAIECFGGEVASKRFPQFRIPSEMDAVFESAAGYLLVEDCVKSHISAAVDQGADWKQETVIGWFDRNDHVQVDTDKATYRAQRLIVSAGPWARTALPSLHDKLTIVSKHMHWFPAAELMQNGCPVYLLETNEGIHYGFPSLDGSKAKVAEHSGGILFEADVESAP